MSLAAGTPIDESHTIEAAAALVLMDLAWGKYDKQVAWAMTFLRAIGLGKVAIILEILLKVNRITAPRVPVVEDGKGGTVPESNSRYNPKTGRFLTGPFGE